MLADRPELIGFFSYSREDDDDSDGRLSALRNRIHRELCGRLGRSRKEVSLWQDTAAIPYGACWESEIKRAIEQSVFFIPIVTPRALKSHHCALEFDAFLGREAQLGRDDLIFPILYIPAPLFQSEQQRKQDRVWNTLFARQYADWTAIRLDDAASSNVAKHIERFCIDIVNALVKPWDEQAPPPVRPCFKALKDPDAVRPSEEEDPVSGSGISWQPRPSITHLFPRARCRHHPSSTAVGHFRGPR